jgi:hypothetical protein
MIERVDQFVRWHGGLLTWSTVAGWSAVGFGALALAARPGGRDRKIWLGSAALALLFAFEMTYPVRFLIEDVLRAALRIVGGDEAVRGRHRIQAVAVLIMLIVSVGLMATFLARAKRLGVSSKLAVVGLSIGLIGFLLETISLHHIDMHYVIYWSIWFLGIALAAVGVADSFVRGDGALIASGASPHARYSVGSAGLRDERDTLEHRTLRLGIVVLVLALPEIVYLVGSLFGTG